MARNTQFDVDQAGASMEPEYIALHTAINQFRNAVLDLEEVVSGEIPKAPKGLELVEPANLCGKLNYLTQSVMEGVAGLQKHIANLRHARKLLG